MAHVAEVEYPVRGFSRIVEAELYAVDSGTEVYFGFLCGQIGPCGEGVSGEGAADGRLAVFKDYAPAAVDIDWLAGRLDVAPVGAISGFTAKVFSIID